MTVRAQIPLRSESPKRRPNATSRSPEKPDSGDSLDLPLAGKSLRVVGLFAGIGGIELGLHGAGHRSLLLCEIDDAAGRVLRARFPNIELARDVRELRGIPKTDVLVAGFPCQDLSQAGRTAGIGGSRSGLVAEVFRLLRETDPQWLVLENVPFMLSLDRGKAMAYLTKELESLGYRWAYRVVNTRAFGLPQRRLRVLLVASRTHDPRTVLFADDVEEPLERHDPRAGCGFYWTEGIRGLGWAMDGVPTLKGGSTVGIPSPPAIWNPRTGLIGTPDIRDAERLQGFPEDWTLPSIESSVKKNTPRWKLVGNAVSVPVAKWLGGRLRSPGTYDSSRDAPLEADGKWPTAAWGRDGKSFEASVSTWPIHEPRPHLLDFLRYPLKPLSIRATAGFLSRTEVSTLRFPVGFLDAVAAHLEKLRSEESRP